MQFPDLLPSWHLSLRAKGRSPETITSYMLAAKQLAAWLIEKDRSLEVGEITKADVEGYILNVYANRASATARQRYASLQQFFKWAEAEREISENPMRRMIAPKVQQDPVPVVPLDDIRRSSRRAPAPTPAGTKRSSGCTSTPAFASAGWSVYARPTSTW